MPVKDRLCMTTKAFVREWTLLEYPSLISSPIPPPSLKKKEKKEGTNRNKTRFPSDKIES